MLPDTPQNQAPNPAPLPSGPSQPDTVPTSPAGTTVSANEQASNRARQLVIQYQYDPYALSEALQRLKAQYLDDQFHISIKPVDD